MKKTKLILAFAAVALLGAASQAEASSRHERVEVTPIKEGKQIVGLKLKLTLIPSGHKVVRIGLGPNTMKSSERDLNSGSEMRAKASDAKKGYLVHQWKEIKIENNDRKEIELEIKYKDAPKLKPGADIEIVSTWNDAKKSGYWHVWGLQVVSNDKNNLKKAPGKAEKPAAKRKTHISEIKRSGRRVKTRSKRAGVRQVRTKKTPRKKAIRTKSRARR